MGAMTKLCTLVVDSTSTESRLPSLKLYLPYADGLYLSPNTPSSIALISVNRFERTIRQLLVTQGEL